MVPEDLQDIVHMGCQLKYIETPPYGHLGNRVTSFLRPLFWPPGKMAAFSCKKTVVTTAKFIWPIGDRIKRGSTVTTPTFLQSEQCGLLDLGFCRHQHSNSKLTNNLAQFRGRLPHLPF